MLKSRNIASWDERRDLIVPGDERETIRFAAEHWIHSAQRAIQQKGRFAVALAGGSTPKAIYRELALASQMIDWSKVFLYWSDERAVFPDHPDSNYRMAMENGFSSLPIPKDQIFRMVAEENIEKNAIDYEEKIRNHLGKNLFDFVMLGLGEDGHTASLFPGSRLLEITDRLAAVDMSPTKGSRMTLTFPCIDQSSHATVYAIGRAKNKILEKVLNASIISPWPASRIGTVERKALWIIDDAAAQYIK